MPVANIYRTSAFGPAIPPRITSGGFALFANGTGTATFDSFSVTQYPNPALPLLGAGRATSSLVNWNANLPTNTNLVVATSVNNGVSWNTIQNPGDAIAGVTTQFYTTLVKQKIPLAYFQLAEQSGTTVFDSSISGYSATTSGGVTLGSPGPLQGPGEINVTAATFDGTSGSIALPTALNGNGFATLTVEGWFKLSTGTLGGTTVMLASGTTAAHTGYQLYWNSTTSLNFAVGNGTTTATATVATTATAGTWLYIAGVYDGANVKLSINGVQQATAALTGAVSASVSPVIGASTALANFYPGTIGQIGIYNQALSASDITARYNAGIVTALQLYQSLVLGESPSGYYQLSEQSGTTANDSGPNAYAGTINGGVALGIGGPLLGASETGVTAMAFDGSTGYIALPNTLNTGGWTQFSVECWVYLPALPTTNNPRLIANSHASVDNSGGFELAVAGTSSGSFPNGGAGTVGLSLGTGTTQGSLSSLVPISPQVWNHLVFTWDGSAISYYANGSLQTSVAFSGTLGTPSSVINIGRNPVYAGDYAAATIGQVAIYNDVLTAADVAAHYNAGQATASTTILDNFDTNSSPNYTQTNYAGGVTGTWTWDTANSRLVGSGGTNGTLSYNGVTSLNSQVFADIDEADGSGLLSNVSSDLAGNRNLYALQIWDSQAASNQNSVKLFKRFGGVNTQLGSTVSISFTRGTYHHFILDVEGGVLTVTMDGAQIIQQTDGSPLLAGQNGLLLNSLLRVYTFQLLQYLPSVTSQSLQSTLTLSTTDPTATPQVLTHVAAAFGPQIDAGVVIPSADYRDTLLSANGDDLAKQSNLSWYTDQNASVWFKQTGALSSAWILQSAQSLVGTDIEIDSNFEVDISGDLYRNRQTITHVSNTVPGSFNSFVGDGFRRDFTLRYKVSPGTVPVVTRDGIRQTVGVKGTSGFQWYYKETDQTISQDTSQSILSALEVLRVSYTGYYTSTVTIDNVAAQQALAALEGGSGIIEQITDGHDIAYSAAVTLAQQLLSFYSVTGRTIQFKTYRNGLQVGQVLPVYLPEENLNGTRMYITQIDLTMQTQPNNTILYGYVVQATELPNIGSWQKLLASGLLN